MSELKKILVAGGAGYIGSHMVRLLQDEGYSPLIFDNLSTGHRSFIPKGIKLYKGDLRKYSDIEKALKKEPVDIVMYFAASIVTSESVENPIKYYENNVLSNINLIKAMRTRGIKKIIFSSTAAIYGEPSEMPITEETDKSPANPYGRSKLMIEDILKDCSRSYDFRYVSLRYFNVAGSHPKADIGIRYKVITHLIPSVLKVISGERKEFNVYGDDYPTPDGSCIRDFIYVMDLCKAHLRAIDYLNAGNPSNVFNLGSGRGFSVKEVVSMCEKVTGKKVNLKLCARRPGDPAQVIASSDKALKTLGWKPQASLEEIIRTAWQWELNEQKIKLGL